MLLGMTDGNTQALERGDQLGVPRFRGKDGRYRKASGEGWGGSRPAHKVGPHSRGGLRPAQDGPQSQPRPLARVDRRTREGVFLDRYERMLVEHLGGALTATQAALISRTARLALHLELLDRKSLTERRPMNATDQHFYSYWANCLARHLKALGFEPPTKAKVKRRTLDEILADVDTVDGTDEQP
jgi:hypothetical protein